MSDLAEARPRFSFIIPAYNAAATVERCLRSILSQTEPDLEVVLIDDVSSDDTVARAERISDARLRIIRAPVNGGPGATRNLGLQHALGSYVAFVDADDWIEPGFVEAATTVLRDDETTDFIAFGYRVINDRGVAEVSPPLHSTDLLQSFLRDEIISAVWAKLYRLDLIRRLELSFQGGTMEDSPFNVGYLARCLRPRTVAACVYNYDKRGESETNRPLDQATIEQFETAIAASVRALGEAAGRYREDMWVREFRMLAMNGLRRLQADRARGKERPEMVRWFAAYLRRRFGLRPLLGRASLTRREQLAYLLFCTRPNAALAILGKLRG